MENLHLSTYEKYLTSTLSMTLEEMNSVYAQMIEGVNDDEDAQELFRDILENAISYIQYRGNWTLWDRESKINNDESRSHCHNSLIVKFNVYARYMKSKGYSTEWRDVLGDENEHTHTRKRIGDFACYMVFINALGSR